MSSDSITFYTSGICPYAQRAAIALKEVGAEYESVEIDLANKPEWYKDINPETKVPAITTEGQNIAESLVIIEYINDRFPEKNLLPKEPIKRANIRFAIEYFGSKITPETYKYIANANKDTFETYVNNVNAGFKRFNELLVQQSSTGPYFLGEEFSLADVGIAPFLQRLYGITRFVIDDSNYEFEQVKANPRLAEFIKGALSRPSIEETYCGDEELTSAFQRRFNLTKL